jgi:hypothetical protein
MLTIVYIERLRVVPTSASCIHEDGHLHLEKDGDGHLHLEKDGDGHHHLEEDDDCHLQLEEMSMARHIWLYYVRVCVCVCDEIENGANLHVLYG